MNDYRLVHIYSMPDNHYFFRKGKSMNHRSGILQKYVFVLILVTAVLISSCKNGHVFKRPNPQQVLAVTSGIIERSNPVKVLFTEQQDTSIPLPADTFTLSPRTEGSLSWENEWTLVFTPKNPLSPGKKYQASVNPALFAGDIRPFSFSFKTKEPFLEVSFNSLKVDDSGEVQITGTVEAEKAVNISKLETVFKGSDLGSPEWTHENGKHSFAFKPVIREEHPRTLAVNWDGRALGAKEKGFTTFHIPEAQRFEVLDIRPIDKGILEVSFSSPVKQNQDLRGFVSFSGNTNVRYSIDGNIAHIFGADELPAESELIIQDLLDINDTPLYQPVQYRVDANWELPEVRYPETRNILPTSQGASLVIETRNVSGILVEAFEIYGNNIVQFLQVNDFDGTNELYRVGEPVWVKAFDFPWKDTDQNTWVRRGLDLSELARKKPDSMFHIRISFRKRHIKYQCPSNHSNFSNLDFPDDTFPAFAETKESESSYWDYYDDSGRGSYDWRRNRFDPCHPAFYEPYDDHEITKGLNVLVSDLGLMVKRTVNGEWFVTATDLKTAKPIANADIQLLTFQGRVLENGKTGMDGMLIMKPQDKAAFLSARNAGSRAYIKLNDSFSLATSHFDISGESPESGINGLIFGERGVWRPGDAMYLTFLLSDPRNTLPKNHPVLFELYDPQGRVVDSQTFTSSVNGFYAIRTATRDDAPTGDYYAKINIGGSSFNKNLKVETVMPNRLKMVLDAGNRTYLDNSRIPFTLTASWLHGAPAPNLKADVSVIFAEQETRFNTFSDYVFKDPSRSISDSRQMLYDGTLDKDGKSSFNVQLSPGQSVPGKLYARFLTRVFEPSGLFSSEQITMDYSPYGKYVGLKMPKGDEARNMLLTDTDHSADIVVVDPTGKLATDKTDLRCYLYKMNWRWWWEKGTESTAEFARTVSRSPVMSGSVTANNGRATWKFRVNYPDWGRYLLVVRDAQGGHSTASIVYIDWPGWAGRAQSGTQGSAAMLSMTASKQKYAPGEAVSVTFPSNKNAMALVILEKAGQIMRKEWVNCAEGSTKYEFLADASMSPNIYVHVTLLQQHLQTMNDLPIRLYGILPITVDDPSTKLTPVITASDNWEPSSRASFTVKESSGRPMSYMAVVVDEGLLGLTRYRMPDPRSSFYRKEASILKSWDLFSSIMGAYSGRLETLLAIGGDDDVFDDTTKKTDRFKPVVRYFGPYSLKANESKTETFDLPEYVGAVRIMVVAASDQAAVPARGPAAGRAYGTTEKSVTVSSDLMVLGTVPRVLSPQDEVVIPVSVFSYREGSRAVTVTFAIEGTGAAYADSNRSRTINFTKPGDSIVEFRVKAADIPGSAKFKITATSPGLKTAVHETNIQVRSTAVPVTKVVTKLIEPNETWTESLSLPGRRGTNTAILELSKMPPLNLEKRIGFLVQYPHGCVEQTTSSVFPQLYLDKLMTLDNDKLGEIRKNINAGIDRLTGFQTSSGGLSYWPGEERPNQWGTNYAGHFLVEAKRAGYVVPAQFLDKWIQYQKGMAASWMAYKDNTEEAMTQAYRLYTLALAGSPDIGSMNRLKEVSNLPVQASWRLALAYWYAGQRDTARTMVNSLNTRLPDYRELSGTFGSTMRDKSMILEAMNTIGIQSRGKELMDDISRALASDNWLSTQETAYAFIAVTPYLQGTTAGDTVTLEYTLQGTTKNISFATPVQQIELGSLQDTTASMSIRNRSGNRIYARIITKGLPPEGTEPSLANGLSLSVEYRNMNRSVIDPNSLPVGEDMEISVRVRNIDTKDIPEVALVHIIPASWEIINTRLGDNNYSGGSSSFKYQDIRDDRVMTYFNLSRGSEKTVTFRVNRTYQGNYFRPAIHAYAMYDESIQAMIPGVKYSEK